MEPIRDPRKRENPLNSLCFQPKTGPEGVNFGLQKRSRNEAEIWRQKPENVWFRGVDKFLKIFIENLSVKSLSSKQMKISENFLALS